MPTLESTSSIPHQKDSVTTFAQMLDPSTGTRVQRAVKAYITPHNPKGTIKLLKKIGVDRFQRQLITINKKKNTKLGHQGEGFQDNYNLGSIYFESVLEFATNKTTENEFLHLPQLLLDILAIHIILSTEFRIFSLGGLFLCFLNTYSILSQRYTRARMSLVIDELLKRDYLIDNEYYDNKWDIKLP